MKAVYLAVALPLAGTVSGCASMIGLLYHDTTSPYQVVSPSKLGNRQGSSSATTFGHGPRASSARTAARRTVNVQMIAKSKTYIFIQNIDVAY